MNKGNTYGRGSVSYSKSKKLWMGQISVGKDENNKTKRKTVYGKTKDEVKKKLKNIEFEVYTGDFLEKSEITIYHLAKQINDDKLCSGKIKDGTYYRNKETIKRLSPIYKLPLQKTTTSHLKGFLLNEREYSQSVINKEYELLKSVFAEAIKRNIILEKENPMKYIEKPRSKVKKTKVRGLTIEERKDFVEILHRDKPLYAEQMLISLYTGMRIGEVNALKVSDVNYNFKCISISRTVSTGDKGQAVISDTPKTKAGIRTIPMIGEVKEIFVTVIGDKESGYIFTKNNGKPISTGNVKNQFNRIRKKYDFIDDNIEGKVNLHSLRHTYATMCIESGMTPDVLKGLLGHTDIRITMNTYADVFDSYQRPQMDNLVKYLYES